MAPSSTGGEQTGKVWRESESASVVDVAGTDGAELSKRESSWSMELLRIPSELSSPSLWAWLAVVVSLSASRELLQAGM